MQAAAALKATWTRWPGAAAAARVLRLPAASSRRATRSSSTRATSTRCSRRRATVVKATYLHPYQMHGSMGTSCAVADVQGGKATVWSSTQSAYPTRSGVAMLLGMPPDNVRVIFTRGSGCYGINGADTVSYDAALLSQAVGKPVRVQLSRKDEMAWENYGFAYVIDQRAGVERRRDHRRVGPRGVVRVARRPARLRHAGQRRHRHAGRLRDRRRSGRRRRPSRPASSATAATPRRRTCRDASARHAGGAGTIASERVLTHTVRSPFFTGPLRSPSRLQNTFAHECFLDEIAAHVKADPVAYRLRHLSDPRLKEVVAAAAKAAKLGGAPVAAARRLARPASPAAAASLRALRRRQRLRRDGRRGRGRSGDRHGSPPSAWWSRRTAVRSRIPTACATSSKAARCRA